MKTLSGIAFAAFGLGFAALACATSSARTNGLKPPTFKAEAGPIRVGPMAGEPATGDCNNDGFTDLVVPCGTCCGSTPSPLSGHVQVLLGNGRGQFAAAPGSPIKIGSSARKVALGDANRDRNLDIFVAQHDSYDVVILLGDGRGGFKPAPSSPVVAASGPQVHPRAHTHDIAAADLNRDGNIDILTTNANDNSVSVLLGDGSARFAPAEGSPFRAGQHPYDVVAACDVNSDGKLDILTPNLKGNAIMSMLGDGKGGFQKAASGPFPAQTRPGYIAVADLNGDEKPDVIATHDDYPLVVVLLGDGAGGFKPTADSPLRPSFAVWGVATGDVNGDHLVDLVCGSQGNEGVAILLGDGKGGFEEARSQSLPAGEFSGYVALADFDKDGKLDIAAASYGSGEVTVFMNRTK
jgi:hypothetical protein